MKMKYNFLIILVSLLINCSCSKKIDSSKSSFTSEVPENYSGAFDTFYNYINTLNNNALSENIMSGFFNENFSIIGNPNITLSNISEITKAYNGIRNQTYPFICSPNEFQRLKLAKLAYLPLTKNSINIALLDVFLCSPDKTPSYKMCFIYQLVFDESKKKWLMNTLTELNPKNYPLNWNQVEIKDSHKYSQNKPLSKLTPLLASELMNGNKSIE